MRSESSFSSILRRSTPVLPLLAAFVIPTLISNTATAAWQWQMPPTLVDLQSSRRNNVFYVGDAIAFKLNKSGATKYAIRDYYGNIVEQGAVTSTTLAPTVKAPGWYKVYLYGGDQGMPWADSVGGTMFCILRDDPNFPKMPPSGTYGGEGLIDEVARGVLGYGPQRHKVDNASFPDTEIARLDVEIAMDQKYYMPFDPLRKRELLIVFPNGTTDSAGVRKIVEHFKTSVKYWEPRNEPNFAMGATAFVNNELKPFYQLVKSVDPSLKVLGPGAVTVGPNMAGFNEEFFKVGGAQYVDAFSFHAYNCVNGDLGLTRMALEQVDKWLKTYNATGLEKWQTEQGFIGPVYGGYQPRMQGRWTMLEMMVYEQYGIPKEHNHYWYDKNGGFWDEPRWVENEDGSLNPVAALLRVYSEELYGTTFNKAYDFGSPGNKLLVGNLFTGPNKQVAALMTAGDTDLPLELTMTGATSVKVVSPFGVEQVLPVVNGKVLLHVSELPSYVEFTGTLAVTPLNWGANLALQTGVTAAASGTTVHPIDSSINNTISKVINGQLDTWYWIQNNDSRIWESNNATYPAWFELRLPSAQTLDRVVIYAGIPWQWDGSIIDYELQIDQGGQWVSLSHVKEPVNTFRAFTPTNRTTVDSFYSERCVFTHSFAPVTTGKIRLLVNEVTWGGAATKEMKDAGAQGGEHQLNLREIEVYRSGAVVAQNKAPLAVADSASCYLGASVTIPVLANDSDPDGGPSPLTVASVGVPKNGTASIVAGQIVYTAAAGFSGLDSFTYTISDGQALSTAMVNVTVSATPAPTPTDVNGLFAEYFNNADLSALVFSRVDPYVDNMWGTNAPDPKMDPTTFSIRWTGKVQPKYSESYTFYTNSDDGVRLWVNGQLLVDHWNDHPATVDKGVIQLVAGQRYDLKLEYYQGSGSGQISMMWSSPTQVQEVVPFGALFLPGATSTPPPVVTNKPPVAVNDSGITNEGVALTVPVLANDSDPDSGPKPLSISAVGLPGKGTAAIAAGGIVYTPNVGFYGVDQFTYQISDGALTSSGSVSVSVNSTAKAYDLSSGGLAGALIGTAGGSSRLLADGTWELNASGVGASGVSDALRMEGQSVTGDFRTVVRVQGISGGTPLARLGLILRENGQVGARTAMVAVTAGAQNVSGSRLVAGASFAEVVAAGADAVAGLPNAWLMLERVGDSVRCSVSGDGTNYRPVAAYTLTGLGASVQVGLFAASGNAASLVRGVVSSWALTRPVAGVPTGQKGLLGVYFSRNDLTQPEVARVDDSVNFTWSMGGPHVALPSDNFSARWTGQVIPSFTEKYTFYTQADDGVRLWVNGQLLVNHWDQHSAVEDSGSISLVAGTPYELKLEYFEAGGSAQAKLLWSSVSQAKQVIPGAALRPSVTPVPIGTGASASVSVLADGTREFTAFGSGVGASASDQGGALTQMCSGDFQIAIRVRSVSGGSSPKTAVMLREGLAAGDRFAAVQVDASGAISVVSRTKTGAVASVAPATGALVLPNAWLLIERRGDNINLAVSSDDITYRKAGTVLLAGLPQLVQVGAFLGSGDSVSAKTVLGDYELTPVTAPGLTAQYFGARDLTNLRLTRTDAGVNGNWGTGSPDPSIPVDGFSVRWTGKVLPRFTENYTFYVQADDGMRLWVDGQLLVDNWMDHSVTESSGTVSLTAGKWVDVKLEYYENLGAATARLLWASPKQVKEIIPATQLSTP
ncbi:MAG: PA14 domain-containing protein [Verrucomicrobiota bacterium]